MDFRPLIKDSLQLLSISCLNPFPSNLVIRIFGMCSALVVMGVTIDVLLILGFTYQGSDSTKDVLSVIAIIQIAIKTFFLMANKKEIVVLINNTNMFRKPNPYDFEQQEENKKIFSFVKSSMRYYVVLLMLTCLIYFTRPLFYSELVELPWNSCCRNFFIYKVCYVLEVFEAIVLVPVQIGFDTLYIALIANIICEFKLVKQHFPYLKVNPMVHGTDKEAMDELQQLIDHHNLILQCTKIMKLLYRVPLLLLFLSNMFGMCFSMIVMTSGNADNTTKVQFLMMTIFYLIELFFFCISGSLLADESMQISYEAYNSQWWIKTQPELRKSLIMVIQRSNKPEILTAGGLFQVNLETFRMILRSSASFITFMQVKYGNS